MRPSLIDRKIHYWTAACLALPVLVIISTGLLLQLKKQWSWVQPPEQRGTGATPRLDLEGVLAAVRGRPELGVDGWEDIQRLDVRPSRGLVKVWLSSGWEVQVDLGTGGILHAAYRRSDLIEAIHDGSFFAGDLGKLGVFLPAGIGLLVLWISGLWLFVLPFARRRKNRRLRAQQR